MKLAIVLLISTVCLAGTKQLKCGVERWDVKTLADKDAVNIATEPTVTTVQEMTFWKVPAKIVKNLPRQKPVEFTRFRMRALLLAYKEEADKDFHLVIADSGDPSITMVAEIPDASCVDPAIASIVDQERTWLVAMFGRPLGIGQLKHLNVPQAVIIEGVGFFDIINAGHHPTGAAPNGAEIHPVLKIGLDDGKDRKNDDEAVAKWMNF